MKAGTGAQRLLPAFRLGETDEFSSVFAFRRSVRSKHFCLHFRPNGSMTARLGIATPKKFLARAVSRNTVRRIGREAFRRVRSKLPAHDMVLRVTAPLDPIAKGAIRCEIEALLAQMVS